MSGIAYDCSLCHKRFKNKHTFQSHVSDIHDGSVGRLQPLLCPVQACAKSYQSRQKFADHLCSHPVSDTTSETYLCPRCEKPFASVLDRDKHLDVCEPFQTEKSSVTIAASETVDSIGVLKGNLVGYTKNIVTAEFVMNMTCPMVLSLDDDSKVAVLGTPNMEDRLRGRRIIDITKIQSLGLEISDSIPPSLSQALLAHHYGKLVSDDLGLYKSIDDKTCSRDFKSSARKISKKLAGALIHSIKNVLLILNVEVYGRTMSEDPHQQPLAYPVLESYVVRSVEHDRTTKIVIGTASWLALVTSCVQQNTGDIVIGPHNTDFTPYAQTTIYLRKDYKKNISVQRHLRSKFDKDETYMELGGIKTLAATFYQLYQDKALSRTCLAKHLRDSAQGSSRISQDLHQLQQMLSHSNSDMVTVTESISQQLRVLAEHTVGSITRLNHTVVKQAVQNRIEIILNAKP
ncbi:hypothetical protein EDD21DRAFT_421459 [Dissophora ornata]|nr:hypothetical protein EDD21DRAFT_421459 [Dissophora ornata]